MSNKKILYGIGTAIVLLIITMVVFLANAKTTTYVVMFDTEGGSEVEKQIIKEGEKVTKPNDPKKEGYEFGEWMYEGKTYDFEKEVEKDMILKATWKEKIEEDKKTYLVIFDTEGGTKVSTQTIVEGTKITKPEEPTKEGYKFVGWYINEKEYDFENEVTENITLTAKWEKVEEEKPNQTPVTTPTIKKYTVTFDSKGGSTVKSQTVAEGGKATKPSDPTRSGYTFEGWTLNGVAYNFNNAVTKNITLVATWKEKVKATYTVTFDSKGGSAVSSQSVIEGNKVSKPVDPTKVGYTFTGWTLNGATYNFNNTVTKNITLVATWKEYTYVVKAVIVDELMPTTRALEVYENGKKITAKGIYYTDGVLISEATVPNVNINAIKSETKLKVKLNDGRMVEATLEK